MKTQDRLSFNGTRLKAARKRRGMTITKLAGEINMTSRIVSGYENGSYVPPSHTLELIANTLEFPTEFFSGHDLEDIPIDTISFRSTKKMRAANRNSVHSATQFAVLLNDYLENQFELPSTDLLDLRYLASVEAAAETLRVHWGIGESSIRNMIHLLESKGIRVFSLAERSHDVDACSCWVGETPFIFLNTLKSPERSRFDAAHELGHLVLHKHGNLPTDTRPTEREADNFASAFLMPAKSVLAVAPYLPSISSLIQLKKRWGVSLSALVRRLKDLSAITEWQYRTLCIEISKQNYTCNEPEGMPDRESSQLLNKILIFLRKNGVNKYQIASELSLPSTELDMLLFNLAMHGIDGGKPSMLQKSSIKEPNKNISEVSSEVQPDLFKSG